VNPQPERTVSSGATKETGSERAPPARTRTGVLDCVGFPDNTQFPDPVRERGGDAHPRYECRDRAEHVQKVPLPPYVDGS